MTKFNPEMMILARERIGLSQSELAKKSSLTQATISRYESGIVGPPSEHLQKIADALNRPLLFFYLAERTYGASHTFHRKRGISLREERKINAQINEIRIQAAILLKEAEIHSNFEFHRLDLSKATPEKCAQQLRQLWQLPSGPVRSVVNSIERAGGMVFRCMFTNDRVDGVSQWPLDNDTLPPVFFVNENSPGDRQRFTLAHEIGHVVMHHRLSDNPEMDADRFASEFLMPAREIGHELNSVTLEKLATLKCNWKVSIASLIRRAKDLNKISVRQYSYFNSELSRLGYKKCEPIPVPPEEPRLFNEVIRVHRQHHYRSVRELSEMMGMYEFQFREAYWQSTPALRQTTI